ncbi:NADH-quinone oxidoreductase subunit D [Candidatus Eisenbacteria bacterium]|uniref:NADH-quinone oxidoreductase subunit D n=1 Tax=Eiseniibacteriota bacterium TaxID=2212470 RepID=A0ABV6YIU7_UNCEI
MSNQQPEMNTEAATATSMPPRHRTFLNLGPAHPAMHGIVRMVLEIEGEKIIQCKVEIGYLHRAFEKHCECGTWTQAFPYTDRLNYVSPFINNFGYAAAVEKLAGIQIPERAEYIRVLMSEVSRITDHLTCVGAVAMELGAMTPFLYFMEARERLYHLIEEVSGARITVSYGRIGGVKADLPVNFDTRCRETFPHVRKAMADVHKLITKNRIFVDRLRNVGGISRDDAISYGFSGPLLRACGVEYDVRKAFPYHVYDRMKFEIPLGHKGDTYDRYLVRMEEIEQSLRICEQCLEQMPGGFERQDLEGVRISPAEVLASTQLGEPVPDYENKVVDLPPTLKGMERQRHDGIMVDDPGITLPPKEETYSNIESLINHFKIIMEGPGHGIQVPKGEAYMAVEGGNGELGFYVVSEGGSGPYRLRCRGPCFFFLSAFHKMAKGHSVGDVVPIFGSVNMIGGELDR